ncbi:hypothetical protein ABZ177_23215 [Streptomyces sp. NPDC006284]|uniref:hypothetical protein n=1 Tax=Streptomyces sp. NPDC006284 TaxID=3156742 RepID=UPI0033A398AD
MAYWEVAVPFISRHGGRGTQFFTYAVRDFPAPATAERAAGSDALSADAVRHRGGGALTTVPPVAILCEEPYGSDPDLGALSPIPRRHLHSGAG